MRRAFSWLPWMLCAILALLQLVPAVGAAPRPPVASDPVISKLTRAAPPKTASIKNVVPPGGRAAQAAPAGRLKLIEPLTLSAPSGKLGEPLYARSRLRNVGDAPLQLSVLVASGRGPNIPSWDCGTLSWENCGADFQYVENLTLVPGQEYAYDEVRVPTRRGAYWTLMTYQDALTGDWHTAEGSNRVEYSVAGGELQVVEPLRLDPPNPRPGQVVAATARVRNVGELPVDARYLLAAGRGPSCSDWSCADGDDSLIADFIPAEDVLIPPGGEHAYFGLTSGRRAGSYFAEMAYLHAGTELWRTGIGGANRVNYATACDARCTTITSAYRDVLGRAPTADELRTAYDSPFGDAQLRAHLCGLPDRRAAACGGAVAANPLRSILSYLPAVPRLVGR